MPTDRTVKVKDDKFEPASQHADTGDRVQFQNKRSTAVTVSLAPLFYSQSSVSLQPEGQAGASADVTIVAASGTGPFEAPKKKNAHDPKQGDEDIKGDIVVNPKI